MSANRQRNRRMQYRRRVRSNRRSMLAISAVVVLLLVVITVNSMTLWAKERSYQAQEIELEEQIAKEKERTGEIEKLEQYVGTDEYVEEVARDRLGMVHENEIIFKAK